jgi:hypothetical protein
MSGGAGSASSSGSWSLKASATRSPATAKTSTRTGLSNAAATTRGKAASGPLAPVPAVTELPIHAIRRGSTPEGSPITPLSSKGSCAGNLGPLMASSISAPRSNARPEGTATAAITSRRLITR